MTARPPHDGPTLPPRTAELQRRLLAWYGREARPLAWRRTRDPYAVLVSEVMLQQTQAARVEPAYRAFLGRFPTVAALAAAPLCDVLMAWRGLGYNRRAVALHRAAKAIVAEHTGRVPAQLASLRALPGVGEYTARAVRTFAHGADDAPVDTNVARVVTRAVAGAPLARRDLQALADALVPRGRGAEWSAALMDLGARHCGARAPRCDGCPLHRVCAWRADGSAVDPAASPRGPRPSVPFTGSDRFSRGRLVDALRAGSVPADRLAPAAGLGRDEDARAAALGEALVRDGLAVRDGDVLRLPA